MNLPALLSIASLSGCASVGSPPAGDTYTITLDPAARTEPATGRVLLFFITATGPLWDRRSPAEGPFFELPQPIASIAVEGFGPGDSVTIDGSTFAFPESLDALDGRVRVQAVLDVDQTERSFLEGPGNVVSDVVHAEVSREAIDSVSLRLTHVIDGPMIPDDLPNLMWINLRSELLSAFYGRDVHHRAGVALPNGYSDPEHAAREWPVVYAVPGFGGRYIDALGYAEMLEIGDLEFTPQCVFVVLDPESPLGHHGSMDSENHGPRGTALVRELIPHIEENFRVRAAPEARLLYGHSSGGWAVLWLQLHWPDVFGGCWSSAPDPISFARFQYSNLYEDRNVYEYWPGNETPSYRVVDFEGRDRVSMTVREEGRMEYAISPDGRSGQQWDAWEAMFSPRDEATGLPRPLFNPRTGEIDRAVAEHWKKFDIYEIVASNWQTHYPTLEQKVRLLCGEFDNYYLNRAVAHFKDMVELRAGDSRTGPGYIEIVRDGSHDNLPALTTVRIHKEIIAHLQQHNLHD